VELLVVIAVIAILAAMLMPAFNRAKRQREIMSARKDVSDIVAGCTAYESSYSRLPIALTNVQSVTSLNPPADFTFGGTFPTSWGTNHVVNNSPGTNSPYNKEVVAILMDLEQFLDGTWTVNRSHVKNPQRNKYLNAEMVNDDASPGVGRDGIFRDPWGNPYIITLDANNDDKTRDAFYCRRSVSQDSGQRGLTGLFNSRDASGIGDNFEYNGQVMVWSAGPDGKVDGYPRPPSAQPPYGSATYDANKDNILSWSQ